MQPAQPFPASPQDPYRARSPQGAFGPIASTTRVVYTVVVAIMMLGFVTAVGGWTAALIAADRSGTNEPDGTLFGVGLAGLFTVVFLLYVQIGAGLVWIYNAWNWLPWDQRYTRHWRNWLTPSQVALMMLIPYFHYYWMFVANCGLCDALDRLRVSYPTSRPAPKSLAIAACACQLIVPFPVAAILWLIFMKRCEEMTREMSAAMAPRMAQSF
ncbi:MAG: hypothetical protein KF819_36795 [Labilithrix sp.]|nr:hypothetical protein [Labilithrix sp.]